MRPVTTRDLEDLAAKLRTRLRPILGEDLSKHVGNNVAASLDDEYQDVQEASRLVLVQAMKVRRFEFLTGDMIREALEAVQDVEL